MMAVGLRLRSAGARQLSALMDHRTSALAPTPAPLPSPALTPPQVRLYEHLGPSAGAMEDEQEMNDTLGQLLMIMQILDEEIGACGAVGWWVERVGLGLPAAAPRSAPCVRGVGGDPFVCSNRRCGAAPRPCRPHDRGGWHALQQAVRACPSKD